MTAHTEGLARALFADPDAVVTEAQVQAVSAFHTRALLDAHADLSARILAFAGQLDGYADTTIRADDVDLYRMIAARLRGIVHESVE